MRSATSSQTIGPFWHLIEHPEWADLTRFGAAGARLTLTGSVKDGDGNPVTDAAVELWQADPAAGETFPTDANPADGTFVAAQVQSLRDVGIDTEVLFANRLGAGRQVYRNLAKTARASFNTVKPGPMPGRGNAQQAPHFAICLHARGLLKPVMTRAYLDGDPLNETDPLLSSIEDAKRRATLLARSVSESQWRLDIRLQRGPHGETETVFLDI